ncbi:MAG: indolepyruvate oxidoreductase subunit beta family protein [Gammaproteobacteria bacterium]|nr:indolepyruvate oxidoreductase subunit beta family protein [Gammaproteobacteria bacterium]
MLDETVSLNVDSAGLATERPISIAIVAMGGQGGAVLTGWIVALAEAQGWIAQSTSVPGVAQRTGATIYYVEMMQANARGQRPVLAQMPTPDDVDVVIASEFMEAGRSILRGLVTPDRTTLIASSHRALSTIEKMAPGDGIADSNAVTDAIGVVAKQELVFDMNTIAAEHKSVISAALYGTLAASGVLPFVREHYCDVIRSGGKGVDASIQTFNAAYQRALTGTEQTSAELAVDTANAPIPEKLPDTRADKLLQRIRAELPEESHQLAFLGIQKVVDFQDADYGHEYLDHLQRLASLDCTHNGIEHQFAFTVHAAKHLANAMCYDDIIRVARIKTASARRQRIKSEMGVTDDHVLQTTEFMHPRMDEICGILPLGTARWLKSRESLYNWLNRRIDKGRRIKTYSMRWFVLLHCIGSLKKLRRRSHRHHLEIEHRDNWLTAATETLPANYALAVEILKFRRLIKGYSDTHDRTRNKFDQLLEAARSLTDHENAAELASELLETAVDDVDGEALVDRLEDLKTA